MIAMLLLYTVFESQVSDWYLHFLPYKGDRRKVMIDVEGKTGPEILEIFGKVAGATER